MQGSSTFLALFGGPAGSGKSTIANIWSESRSSAVHIEHDVISSMIITGRTDFQSIGPKVEEQVNQVSKACCDLACSFLKSGYDVAIDHVFFPGEFEVAWKPYLQGITLGIVIVRPRLEIALQRGAQRTKQVPEHLVETQYEATAKWSPDYILDTSSLTVQESFECASRILNKTAITIR